MKVTRKALARCIVVTLALFCAAALFVAAEIAVRMTLPELDPRAVFVADPGVVPSENPTVFDYKRFWAPRPNMRGRTWVGTSVTTNSLGIRYDSEIGKKAADTIRIVALGDSVTFGYGVPYEPAKGLGAYPFLLERNLRERHPDWKWEVIPLACPGYTTLQGRFWLEDTIAVLEPDIVVTAFCWNDVCDNLVTNNQVGMRTPSAQRIRWAAQHSQLVTHFLKWRGNSNEAVEFPEDGQQLANWAHLPRTTLEDYILDHWAIHLLVKKHRGKMATLLPFTANITEFPHEGRCVVLYREKLRELCQINSIPSLLVTELSEAGHPQNASLFTGERIHPNADGHKLIAEQLYPVLVPLIDQVTAERRRKNWGK